jgi:hypothetical protein
MELQNLYFETMQLFSGIQISTNENVNDADYGGSGEVMGSQQILHDVVFVDIHPTMVNEYVISHELLHAYLIGKGFPDHHYYGEDRLEIKNLLHAQQALYNTVMHKLIIAEQFKRNVNLEEALNEQITNIVSSVIPEKDKVHSVIPEIILRFFDFLVMYDIRRGEFESLLQSCYPHEYVYAKRLANICLETNYDDPFLTRRVLVRVFREFDAILIELGFVPVELNKRIAIGFVPGKSQLERRVSTTFQVEKTTVEFEDSSRNVDIIKLVSNVDGQLSYCVSDVFATMEEYANLTLIEFYRNFNIKYQLR